MNIATDPFSDPLTLPDPTHNFAAAPAAEPGVAAASPDGSLNPKAAPDQESSTACEDARSADRRHRQAPIAQTDRRKSLVNRRLGLDRRLLDIGSPTGLERRRGPGRRRTDDRRSAEEGEMTDEQFEFMLAVDTYKRINNRPFPSWTEVLEIVKQLGYRKVAQSTITLSRATGRRV